MESPNRTKQGGHRNRTGLAMAHHAEQMRQVPEMTRPTESNDGLKRAHLAYLKDSHAIGSIPPPATGKGMAKAGLEALKGNKAITLVDKAAERLAFERTGVRLYTALLDKMEVDTPFSGGPDREAVERIRDEELQHARMLASTLEEMGADPTALTPSADLVAVEGMGLGAVLGDARTTVGQCLHALLVAELADGEGWTLLRTLAEDMGQDELADRFAMAEREEEDHLAKVRGWLTAHTRAEAELG